MSHEADDIDMAAAAVIAALQLARDHGSATEALAESGIGLPDTSGLQDVESEYLRVLGGAALDNAVRQGMALGYLAGRIASRTPARTPMDPTAFLMDRDLVVKAAHGDSILHLPWVEQELFVGRQLPDIREIPTPIRSLAADRYRAGLKGERTEYAFTSYGHTYAVDVVPVRDESGSVAAVLAVAVHREGPQGDQPRLTAREREVLTLASHGLNYGEIAAELFVTHGTVKTHLANIYAKLEVRDMAAAVATALRTGQIE